MPSLGGATFTGDAMFKGATFAKDVEFREARFASDARFDSVTFAGEAKFVGARFRGDSSFIWTTFTGTAVFDSATFTNHAGFGEAMFTGDAEFDGTYFMGDAVFNKTMFTANALFSRATFIRDAWFVEATFMGDAVFGEATCTGPAEFGRATFEVLTLFGPISCTGRVDLSGTLFRAPVTIEIAAGEVLCARTRWESTATLRLRYATVDLGGALLSSPVAVTAHPAPFTSSTTALDESLLGGHAPGVRVASVRGVDAAHLVLTDADLSECLFSGAFHLDQLRLEGRCTFAATPNGLHYHRI
ncbi:pentapeptide repeat-containing protein [Streptomyces sp. NBC_01003]|uniref:pentapeptide repeat-containing protein n=1 Tax=Streptomyces sp. NBC_01003 TaxID=2903714 RepID=UPI00386B4E0B